MRDVTGINIMQSSRFTLVEKLCKVPEALAVIRDWQAEHLPVALSSALHVTGFGDALDGLR